MSNYIQITLDMFYWYVFECRMFVADSITPTSRFLCGYYAYGAGSETLGEDVKKAQVYKKIVQYIKI